jgi:hypothetical protein
MLALHHGGKVVAVRGKYLFDFHRSSSPKSVSKKTPKGFAVGGWSVG